MEHGSHTVDILNSSGTIIGTKLRKDIDKKQDIYHSVYVLLITPQGEVALSRIKERSDLPNLYVDLYGTTIATIVRTGESSDEAARRAMSRELFIDEAVAVFVGETFETLRDKKKAMMSFFYVIGDPPDTYSQTDLSPLELFSPTEVSRQLHDRREEFAPTFQLLWEKYSSDLPL